MFAGELWRAPETMGAYMRRAP